MSEPGAPLSSEDLARFCDFVRRRTGMIFGETKRYYIDRRVAERISTTGEPDFRAWFQRLRRDPAEFEQVVSAFTINETYFYREAHQFACMCRDLLPELIRGRTPGDLVRILCNPCSTGEEPYSVAIWLLENWPLVDAFNVEIVGADIDAAALRRARDGWYNARALAKLPPAVAQSYFGKAEGDRRQLIVDLRESVQFAPANLIDANAMRALGRFDLIFCRNVLIYFDEAARRTAAEHLYDALNPGGFVLLGHTESMGPIDDRFLPRRFPDAVVYQRPEGA